MKDTNLEKEIKKYEVVNIGGNIAKYLFGVLSASCAAASVLTNDLGYLAPSLLFSVPTGVSASLADRAKTRLNALYERLYSR